MTMHCGYPFYLFLVLWAELAAGGVVPTNTADPHVQSIIEDLQEALKNYDNNLKTIIPNLPDNNCTDTVAGLQQSSTVAKQLSKFQKCAQELQSYSTDALCQAVRLNTDLLQHLESSQGSTACPVSSSSSSPLDFNSLRRSIKCVHCWSQQVAALRR